jgi:secreted trypsin-like serine protease
VVAKRKAVAAAMIGFLVAGIGVAAPSQANQANVQPRVIGGSDVAFADFPWQVLFIIENSAVCGGALVSPTKVVSAAHCFTDKTLSDVQAWAGISKMSERSAGRQLAIASITSHPNYNEQTYANDIAVVTLKKPVASATGAVTIALPSAMDARSWPSQGTPVTVSGWGETDPTSSAASDQLQAATVDVLAGPGDGVCGQYGSIYLAAVQICAGEPLGGVDACAGDSGGPLTAFIDGQPILAGISSTGFECAEAGYPGLYVRVTAFLPWLAQQGIEIKAGSRAVIDLPGRNRDGVSSSFRIGQTYARADFAKFAKLSPTKSQLTVIGGAACTQVKQAVRIDAAGKCRMTLTQGKKRVPIVLTVYSA